MKRNLCIIGLVILFCNVYGISFQAHIGRGYIPHNSIHIDGNDNFTAENGVVGGNGTVDDPYLIQGWQIDYAENISDTGIWIGNTTSYFIIRNCSIQEFPYAGINLTSVINGRIESCAIDSHTYTYPYGIYLGYCSSVVISLNRIGAFTGILLNNCSSDLIRQNTVEGTWLNEGIRAQYGCFSLSFINNTVSGFWRLGSDGFTVYGDNNTLEGNTIRGIGDGAAIYGGLGNNIRIVNNTITGCATGGGLQYCNHAYIAYNYIHHNGNGFGIGPAKDCIFEYNILKYNRNEWGDGGGLGTGTNSSNITFRYNIISHDNWGLCFSETTKNFIYNNQLLETDYGIYFLDEPGSYAKQMISDNLIQNNTITAHKVGIFLTGHSQRNTITLNSVNGSINDVYLQDWSKDNRFIHNNFLSKNQSSHCYFKLRLNSVKEVWDANYWSGPRTVPVVIHGKTGIFRWMLFPWCQIETNPAKTPYTVPG
jgi:hypothetical protein